MTSIAVVGVDFGSSNCKIGKAIRGGVNVILNESSERLTAALVSFKDNERYLGSAASSMTRTNMANTITHIKRFIGRKFSEAGVQEDLKDVNFRAVAMENDEIGVKVDYSGEERIFSMTQILGMQFAKMRQIVELNHKGVTTVDSVISLPCYFTDAQRRAVKDAASIGGLDCLQELNDGTAAALSYGIFKGAKKEFPDNAETPVLFLDMGASQFTATAVGFTNTSLRVLASVCDSNFGGGDIDVAIAKFFASEFAAKFGSDPWKSAKARLKLLAAAEKAKITLSPHGVNEAPVNIECLFEDRDYTGKLTIDKLDELIGGRATASVGSTIARCLAISKLRTGADFSAIELVGGSMRPRAVKRAAAVALALTINEATGHGLSQSMNLDEAVARGCALACAMASTVFKVKPFDIVDSVPASVRLSWEPQHVGAGKGAGEAMDLTEETGTTPRAMDTEDGGADGSGAGASATSSSEDTGNLILFRTGDGSPLTRRATLGHMSKSFEVSAEYNLSDAGVTALLPRGTDKLIGKYRVEVPEVPAGEMPAKVSVEFRHTVNGTLELMHAHVLKEVKEAAAPPPPPMGGDVKMEDAAAAAAPAADAAAAAAAAAPKKKRYQKIALSFTRLGAPPSLLPPALAAAVEQERKMAAQDADIHATQDMRNNLEALIYSMRKEIADDGSLFPFSTPAERELLTSLLETNETWLYEEGFGADKVAYAAKLSALTDASKSVSSRKTESDGRYTAVGALKEAISHYRDVLANTSGKFGHLEAHDHDTLRATTSAADKWLSEKISEQSKLEAFQDPAVKVAELNATRERLSKDLGMIERKPVPAPAAAPVPAAAPAPAATAPAPMETEAADAAAAPPAAPMEVEPTA